MLIRRVFSKCVKANDFEKEKFSKNEPKGGVKTTEYFADTC